jgi:hypothetical protein
VCQIYDLATVVSTAVIIIAFRSVTFPEFIFLRVSRPHQQFLFDAAIAVACFSGMGKFLFLAFRERGADDSTLSPPIRQDAIDLRHGELKFQLILYVLLPLVSTPAGTRISTAKALTFINLALYAVITAKIYLNIDHAECHDEEMCTAEEIRNKRVKFITDLNSQIVAAFGVFYHSCLTSMEQSERVMQLLKAERETDSILNHSLKNSVAGAVCLLEVEQQEHKGATDGSVERIQLAIDQLHRTMEWVSSRQVLLDLSSGNYQTSLSVVNGTQFVKSVASTITVGTYSIHDVGIPGEVAIDEKMCRLGLDNAVTNAIAHGDGGEVKFGISFLPSTGASWC